LSHAQVALEEAGKCRLTGIARPRPFQIEVAVSRPSLALTSKGAVFSWVDTHEDPRRRQAFTVMLDSSLRRVSMPISVTPEAQNVRQHQLVSMGGDRVALIYWEDGGKEPGVYARVLDAEGKIETSLRKLSSSRKGDYYPTLTPAPNGEFWAVWEEEFENNSSDVVLRPLSSDLEPKGDAVRVTALHAPSGNARQPRTADMTVDRDQLKLVYAQDLGSQHVQVMLQTISLKDPALATGITGTGSAQPAQKNGKSAKESKDGGKGSKTSEDTRASGRDEFVGTVRPVGGVNGRNAEPRVACAEHGCFVAWDDEKTGALTAFEDREKGLIWHRGFANRGARPTLAEGDHGVVVAWFEGARLKLAPLTRDGVGASSVVSRVNGLQPYPDVTHGQNRGEWYLAFRDYESAHLEVFALRAECP
jgi:hypothetical protein